MAILAAMQSAALVLMGRKPQVFFGSPEKLETELSDMVNEVAEDVAQYQDWTELQKIATLTGNGTQTAFDLPTDYGRMMLDSRIQSSAYRLWGFFRYNDLSDYMRDTQAGFRASPGGWIITGGQIKFNPAPTGTSQFPYISKSWARSDSGSAKVEFTDDSDNFLLPERLLKLGLIWRWRESKKMDSTGDQEAFVKALDEYATKDGGSNVIRRNGRGSFTGTYPAWPWLLG